MKTLFFFFCFIDDFGFYFIYFWVECDYFLGCYIVIFVGFVVLVVVYTRLDRLLGVFF